MDPASLSNPLFLEGGGGGGGRHYYYLFLLFLATGK